VRYKGEPIVAVVADSHREAFEALAKIRVDYEPLPTVFDVEEALKPGAPVVNETYPKNSFTFHEKYDHQKLRFGDVERGFAQSDHVLEQRVPDVADRACADRDQRLHRRARHQRPLCRLHLDPGAVLPRWTPALKSSTCHPTRCISSAARSAAASAARSTP